MSSKKKLSPEQTLRRLKAQGYASTREDNKVFREVIEKSMPSSQVREQEKELLWHKEPRTYTLNFAHISTSGFGALMASVRHPVDHVLVRTLPANTNPQTYEAKRKELMKEWGHSKKRFLKKYGRLLEDPLDRIFASKYQRNCFIGNPDLTNRILRETRILMERKHPAIPETISGPKTFEDVQNTPIVMRYYLAKNLREFAQSEKRLEKRIETAIDTVQTLASVHKTTSRTKRGPLLHRDVKPENIMITKTGRLLYIDWGSGSEPDREDGVSTRLTQTGFCIGAPQYMAPETLQGGLIAYKMPAEIYGCGVTVYEITTQVCPFEGRDKVALLLNKINNTIRGIPSQLNSGIPIGMSREIMKAISPNPKDRHVTVAQFANALERYRPRKIKARVKLTKSSKRRSRVRAK